MVHSALTVFTLLPKVKLVHIFSAHVFGGDKGFYWSDAQSHFTIIKKKHICSPGRIKRWFSLHNTMYFEPVWDSDSSSLLWTCTDLSTFYFQHSLNSLLKPCIYYSFTFIYTWKSSPVTKISFVFHLSSLNPDHILRPNSYLTTSFPKHHYLCALVNHWNPISFTT